MNKFLSITKINLIAALRQMNFVRRRAADKHGSAFMFVIALVFLALMAYAGWMSYAISRFLNPAGLEWILLAVLLIIISLFVFSTNLYTVNSVLFESADTEQLFAYPIPKYQILFSKISGLVIENWLVAFVFTLPVVCIYSYYIHPAFVFYIYSLICVLISPLLPLCLIAIISYIVSALTSGTQFKNYLNLVLTIGSIAGITFGITSLTKNLKFSSASSQAVLDAIKHYYPPIGYAVSSLYHYSLTDMLLAVAWNVVPFIILCGILSVFYASLRSRIVATKKAKNGRITFRTSSKLGTMTKKEFARFFSSPMYILNSCVGVILMTVFAIGSGSLGKKFDMIISLIKSAGANQAQIILIIFLFILSITNTTSPSISLEGKNLWLVKSNPIRPKTALIAKLLVHMIILTPLTVINCIITAFTFKTGFGGFVVVLISCLLFILLSGLVGLNYNLHYHRFDFYNDMQVVKNSASVLLTMITMLGIAAVIIFFYWLISQFATVNFYVYSVLIMAIIVGVILYLYRYIGTKGESLFEQL